ncbi:MAG TPA: molybdopterin-binding protein [Kofleriaceae bacterium]|nr:molybdopterin-binding protein [Kofleriaceae bacterium]
MSQTAGIVIIGDEILSGKFADENALFLIGELRALGVDLGRIAVIPDDVEDIGETVATFSARFDHVFTSGGVGPTHDDVTMAGIARGFGTRVLIEPRLEQVLRDHWGPTMPEANLRLAHVPEGCELVGDDERWPVVRYRNVFVLPGVPALFKRKFLSIKSLLGGAPRTERRLYCLGDEGVLAPHLELVVGEFTDVKLGSYPRFHETTFKVILTLEGADETRVEAAWTRLRALLAELVVDPPA